jgi:hypothetical protein
MLTWMCSSSRWRWRNGEWGRVREKSLWFLCIWKVWSQDETPSGGQWDCSLLALVINRVKLRTSLQNQKWTVVWRLQRFLNCIVSNKNMCARLLLTYVWRWMLWLSCWHIAVLSCVVYVAWSGICSPLGQRRLHPVAGWLHVPCNRTVPVAVCTATWWALLQRWASLPPVYYHSVPDGVIRTVKPGNFSRQVMHRDICKDAISEWNLLIFDWTIGWW